MTPFFLAVLVCAVTALGFFIAYEHAKNLRQFSWSEYVLIVLSVGAGIIPVVYVYGYPALIFFAGSVFAGLLMEHLVGYFLHKTLKRHVWRYYRYTLGGYTSLLIAPFWGMAGIFFYLLAKSMGLD